MKTLILFSTRDGQTREIACYLASELKELGIQTDVTNVHRIEEPQWENYDCVVIGASIRCGLTSCVPGICQKTCDATEFNADAFYSVNLVARKPEKRAPQTNSYARKFLMNSQWRPDRCAVIAGALR
ncbi:menaquinone-dependent protoporphyrinogen IX dehydrogenase [Escherichia coli]